jgi:hypothetical protein
MVYDARVIWRAVGVILGVLALSANLLGQHHPDFSGVYSFGTLTPFERPQEFADKPAFTDQEASAYARRRRANADADRRPTDPTADLNRAYNEFWIERATTVARANGQNLTSLIIDPPDGRVPTLTPDAQTRVAARSEWRMLHPTDSPEELGLTVRCLPAIPLISPAGESNLLQIFQTPTHIVIVREFNGIRRLVSMGRDRHGPSAIRTRLGDSIGRWDHEALIVDTTNYRGPFQFELAGADDKLHVVERFVQADANTVLYQATVDDPTAFTRPWTFVLPLKRTEERMFEFACHEGNYALANILRAARQQESR